MVNLFNWAKNLTFLYIKCNFSPLKAEDYLSSNEKNVFFSTFRAFCPFYTCLSARHGLPFNEHGTKTWQGQLT